MQQLKFKILFVIGTGRNGSTTFDIVLGGSEHVKSCGELYNALHAWHEKAKCACSNPIPSCEFWRPIFEQYFSEIPDISLEETINLYIKFERKIYSPLYFLLHKSLKTTAYANYLNSIKTFYVLLAHHSQTDILLDSSKNPLRGAALTDAFPDSVYFVHLIRDGRAQLMSWINSGTIHPLNIRIRTNKTQDPPNIYTVRWWASGLYAFSWILYNILASLIIKYSNRPSHCCPVNFR